MLLSDIKRLPLPQRATIAASLLTALSGCATPVPVGYSMSLEDRAAIEVDRITDWCRSSTPPDNHADWTYNECHTYALDSVIERIQGANR